MKFLVFGAVCLLAIASVSAASGSISVYNSGGYVAKFRVEYTLNGERKSEESGNFSLGVTKSIQIPEGATNIDVKTEEYWFPGQLSTIFTAHFDVPEQKCYKIWGTTLNPSYDSIAC